MQNTPKVRAGDPFDRNSLMTVAELAVYLKLTRSTVYRMVERNEVPCLRIGKKGRTVRFQKDQITEWLRLSQGDPSEALGGA